MHPQSPKKAARTRKNRKAVLTQELPSERLRPNAQLGQGVHVHLAVKLHLESWEGANTYRSYSLQILVAFSSNCRNSILSKIYYTDYTPEAFPSYSGPGEISA